MNNKRSTLPSTYGYKQAGYSLVEWMITIVLTLFLTAGLLSIFVSSHRATSEVMTSGERQENGTFALQLLARDLKQAYFFSQATGENKDLWELNGLTVASADDCLDDISNSSFPVLGQFRALWSSSVPAMNDDLEMECIDDENDDTSLVIGSDYISIKRARGNPQEDDYIDDRFYLNITTAAVTVYEGDAGALTTAVVADRVSPVWEYIHHVYYLDSFAGESRLRRLALRTDGMLLEEVLVEGVENMQFMFALDKQVISERDGSIDALVAPESVTASDWDTDRVIGMKIFLLIKSLETTSGYTNTNSYQLGDYLVPAANDSYKRSLVSKMILFQNSLVLVDE